MREQIGVTGAKEGCDDSKCGACMMPLDGELVNVRSYLALQAEGREITTVETTNFGVVLLRRPMHCCRRRRAAR